MRIGELSSRTGVSRRSLRYYERQGLLASTRAPSGQRHYGDDDVGRVEFIRLMLGAGLPTRAIAELMPCRSSPTRSAAERAAATMRRERDRLTAAAQELLRARDALDALLDGPHGHHLPPVGDPSDDAADRHLPLTPVSASSVGGPRPLSRADPRTHGAETDDGRARRSRDL